MIQAWVVGIHDLPVSISGVVHPLRFGTVIVEEGNQLRVMSHEDFDKEYEWV